MKREDYPEKTSNNPKDYYFQVWTDPEDSTDTVLFITPKDYFDNFNCLLDSDYFGITDLIEQNGYGKTFRKNLIKRPLNIKNL